MLNWAATFFIIALIAGIVGLTGIAAAATNIAWILFVVFNRTVSNITDNRTPPARLSTAKRLTCFDG